MVWLFFFSNSTPSFSQTSYLGISISNNITGMPVLAYPKIFTTQFHPGLDLKYAMKLNNSENNRFYLDLNLGAYHHEFVQTLIRVYPEMAYEKKLFKTADFHVGLGGGYGLSFEGNRGFVKDETGGYANKAFKSARSQYLIAFNFGFNFLLSETNQTKFNLRFASFVQGTYVKSYVPILPLNNFQVGFITPLKTK